jgi:N-methylhydantoinase A/oxoprolinase/acetone carboxylase beta subunit
MADHLSYGPLVVRQLDALIARQIVRRAAFTPTDALHVLGQYQEWDVDAARLGAELLGAQMGLAPEQVCRRVADEVSNRVTTELVTKALIDEATLPDWQQESAAAALLARAIGSISPIDLDCRLSLLRPVVAVGAPVGAYLPRTAEQLSTQLVIPTHADVANAVGAVAGSVVQRIGALVRPMEAESLFRLYMPDGVYDFAHLEQAVTYAEERAPAQAEALARAAGAEQVEVKRERVDRTSPLKEEWGQEMYLETELTFTAVGRPSLTR